MGPKNQRKKTCENQPKKIYRYPKNIKAIERQLETIQCNNCGCNIQRGNKSRHLQNNCSNNITREFNSRALNVEPVSDNYVFQYSPLSSPSHSSQSEFKRCAGKMHPVDAHRRSSDLYSDISHSSSCKGGKRKTKKNKKSNRKTRKH
jgi:hypothetical protein